MWTPQRLFSHIWNESNRISFLRSSNVLEIYNGNAWHIAWSIGHVPPPPRHHCHHHHHDVCHHFFLERLMGWWLWAVFVSLHIKEDSSYSFRRMLRGEGELSPGFLFLERSGKFSRGPGLQTFHDWVANSSFQKDLVQRSGRLWSRLCKWVCASLPFPSLKSLGCDFIDTEDPHVIKHPLLSNLNARVSKKTSVD